MFQKVPDKEEVYPVRLQLAMDVTGEALPCHVEELISLSEQDLDSESEYGRAGTNLEANYSIGCAHLLSQFFLRYAAVSV